MIHRTLCATAALLGLYSGGVLAAPAFVNGLVIDATTLDASGGSLVNDGRMGFFSDLYYDARRDEWWALSDRGPGAARCTTRRACTASSSTSTRPAARSRTSRS